MQPYVKRHTLTLRDALDLADRVFGTKHDAAAIQPRTHKRERSTREVIVVRKRFGRDHVSRIRVTS